MNLMVLRHSGGMTIGQAARLFGLTPRALRLYDDIGLVEADRDDSNRRVYAPAAREELEIVAIEYGSAAAGR